MRDPNSSWWLKVRRAEERLRELETLMIPFDRTSEYRITHRVEAHSGKHLYTIGSEPPDPLIAVVIGDLLYDIRSALDHVAGALLPRKFRYKVDFPILTFDPNASPAADVDPERFKRAQSVWKIFAEHAKPGAFAQLDGMQPFHRPDEIEENSLALANRLYNADKHRELVTVVSMHRPMSPMTVIDLAAPLHQRYREMPTLVGQLTKFEAPIWESATEVQVKLAGSFVIGVRARGESIYVVPSALRSILRYVRDEVLEPLDEYTS